MLVAIVTIATVVSLLIWAYGRGDLVSRSTNDDDLSKLFADNPDTTLDDGTFLDLRDPVCTKSFSFRLAQRVFVRMSRHCKYSIHVESGRARVNFLNTTKGGVELAPGGTWSATDFWSIRPLTPEAELRFEPTP